MSTRTLSRVVLAVLVLSFASSASLAAQCADGYLLEPLPGNPATPLAGRDVILIHGFVPSESSPSSDDDRCKATEARSPITDYWYAENQRTPGAEWTEIVAELQRRGVRVFSWRWPTWLTIAEAGDLLRSRLMAPDMAPELILVGHSMGGLVAMQALTGGQSLRGRVTRVVTLGTPFAGLALSYIDLFSQSAAEVRPNSDYLAGLASKTTQADADITFAFAGWEQGLCLFEFTTPLGGTIPIAVPNASEGDCVVPALSAYGGAMMPKLNLEEQSGKPWTSYDHTQIALNYTARLPGDATHGAELVDRVRLRLIDDYAGKLSVGNPSIALRTGQWSAATNVYNEALGTIGQLSATVTPIGSTPWLSARLSSTSASRDKPSQLTLVANPAGLSAGVHDAEVVVSGFGAEPTVVNVSLTVDLAAAPVLTAPRNVASGTPFSLSWTAVSGAKAYTLDRTDDGSFADLPSVVTLNTGVSENVIVLDSPVTRKYRVRADNSSYSGTASVTISRDPPGSLSATPDSVGFVGYTGVDAPNSADLQLTSNARTTFTWGATATQLGSASPRWISVVSRNGSQSDKIEVRANAADLSNPGTYRAQLDVYLDGNSQTPALSVPISFTVGSSTSSGVNLKVDTAWINTAYRNPANPADRNKDVELWWRLKNDGSRDVPMNPYGPAYASVWWVRDSVAPTNAMSNARTAVLLAGGSSINRTQPLVAGGFLLDHDRMPLPTEAYATTKSYLAFIVDADGDSGSSVGPGLIPESDESDNIRLIPLYIPRPGALGFAKAPLQFAPLPTGAKAAMVWGLQNTGDLPVDWRVTSSLSGVVVSPTAGTLVGGGQLVLTVTADANILAVGDNPFTLSLAGPGGGTVSGSAPVFARPTIAVQPQTLSITAAARDSTYLDLTNAGAGTLDWTIQPDTTWLTVSKTSGSGASRVVVYVDPAGLSPGQHAGAVWIDSRYATNGPRRVPVVLDVIGGLSVSVSPPSGRDTVAAGSPADPDSAVVTVEGAGAQTAGWTADHRAEATWLSLESSNGIGSGKLKWKRSAEGLAPGLFVDTITVALDAGGPPARIVDSLVVVAPSFRIARFEAPRGVIVRTPVSPTVAVTVTDANGKPAVGFLGRVILTLYANSVGAKLVGDTATAVNGVATFPRLALSEVGSGFSLVAHAVGLPDSPPSDTFSVEAALRFVQPPTTAVAGAPIRPSVSVAAVDGAGSTYSQMPGVASLQLQGSVSGAVLTGDTARFVGGVATFSAAQVDRPARGVFLRAVAPLAVGTTSDAFDVDSSSVRDTLTFRLTADLYSEKQNLDSAVKAAFGPDARLADWNDVVAAAGSDPTAWAARVGLADQDAALVSYNGVRFDGIRQFFLQRFDNGPYSSFAIYSKTGSLYLGSWYGLQMKILAVVPATSIMISVAPDPTIGGTATGGGSFSTGDPVSLTATAKDGFAFDGWYEGASKVSSASPYTFSAVSDRSLIARFTSVVVLAPDTLPGAVVGRAYSTTVRATGTTRTVAFAIDSGQTQPPGLSLSASGVLSGVPTNAAGSPYKFTVVGSIDGVRVASHAYSISVVPGLTIVTRALPVGVRGRSYAVKLAATGGSGQYQWSNPVGQLPKGISLVADSLVGTPADTGRFPVRLLVASAAQKDSVDDTLRVVAPLEIVSGGAVKAVVGRRLTDTLTATGGESTYAWTLRTDSLRQGFTVSPSGVLAGSPTAPGIDAIGVRVVSGAQTTDSTLYLDAADSLWIRTDSLPRTIVGADYRVQLVATGGRGTYTWTYRDSLPTGLALSASGLLEGTPIKAESLTVRLVVTTSDDSAERPLPLSVYAAPVIMTTEVPEGIVGDAYSVTMASGGGAGALSWSVDGTLPSGLSLSSDGKLSGTPSVAGAATVTLKLTSFGVTVTKQLRIVIATSSDYANGLASMLLGGQTISAADSKAIDAAGNGNGRVDVGDLLAFLDRHPSVILTQALSRAVTSHPVSPAASRGSHRRIAP